MGTYDSMKKSMLATGLYRLDGSTCADWELQAYAAVLDPLCDDLKNLQKESFVGTAESYGLRSRELALGILWPETAPETRRKTIFTLGSIRPGDCSRAALEKLLVELGITATVVEDIPNRKLTLKVTALPYGGTDTWEQIVGRFLPAHIETVWDYSGMK